MSSAKPSLNALYVEDNPADAGLARRQLSRLAPGIGLEVVTTVSAALELLADPAPPYDVVLTDLRLPDGNGLEILSHIRERELPMAVVIVTGSGDQEAAVAALRAGADDYLVKRAAYFSDLPRVLTEAHAGRQARLRRRARPLSVLYAEPSPFDVDLTRRHLAQHAPNIRLEVAGNGEEVLRRLTDKAAPLPDVLLLDFQLPALNALEVVKTLRWERGIDLPVVLVTGHGTEDVAIQALRLGVDDYLIKNAGYLKQLPVVLEKLQKQAELNKSENRYRSLFENNRAVMLVVDPESGEIMDANPAAAMWYGWSREALCRKNINEICALSPAEMESEIEKVRLRQECCFLLRHRRADGSVRDVEVFSGPVTMDGRPLLYSIVHDITEKKRAEEELKKSETQFRALSQEFNGLLDTIPDSIMLLDPELKVLWANKAAIKNIAASAGEPESGHCYRIWRERATPCSPCPVLECFETGRPVEETATELNGKVWNFRTVPLKDEHGRIVKVISIKRDITEHKKMEAQYLHAQKMESIGTLAGGVAHDFNNILTAIIGYGELALMDMAQEEHHRLHFESILESAERAKHLTRQLLLFSRKQDVERRPVDLNEIIRNLKKFLNRIIGEDIVLNDMLNGPPLPILADSGQMEQVLMNLVVNARDAMARGGELRVQTEVKLLGEFAAAHGVTPGAFALLSVADTGTGIDKATLGRIFDPYFTTKELGKGTGLGLAVVYGIVKQHDGFITVESEPAKGATFRVYLPLTDEALQERGATVGRPVARGAEKILLAEDDEMVRTLMTSILEGAGYTVVAAGNGEDALIKFKENADSIQLLMLDLIMPKMNGKDVSDEIYKAKPGMRTIFTTGYAPDFIREKTSFKPGDNLLHKPVSPYELLTKVRSVLDGAG